MSWTTARTRQSLRWIGRSRRAAAVLGLGVILAGGNGCAALHPIRGVPVDELALDLMVESRTNKSTIDLSLLTQSQPDEHRVGPEDILTVYVPGVLGSLIDRDDETGENPPINIPLDGAAPPTVGFPLQVRGDGTLSLPQVEPIQVEGMTLRQVEQAIIKAYTVDEEILSSKRPRVIVSLQQPRTYEVLVVRQEKADEVAGANAGNGQVNVGRSRKGTARVVRLPAYQNDVLHALSMAEDVDGLPGLDAKNTIYVIRRRGSQPDGVVCETCEPFGEAIKGPAMPGTMMPSRTMPTSPFGVRPMPLPTPAEEATPDAAEEPDSDDQPDSAAQPDATEPAKVPTTTQEPGDLRQALPTLPSFTALPAPGDTDGSSIRQYADVGYVPPSLPSNYGGTVRVVPMPTVPLQSGYRPPVTPKAPAAEPSPGIIHPVSAEEDVPLGSSPRKPMQIIPASYRGQSPDGYSATDFPQHAAVSSAVVPSGYTPKRSMLSRLMPWRKTSQPPVRQPAASQLAPAARATADGNLTSVRRQPTSAKPDQPTLQRASLSSPSPRSVVSATASVQQVGHRINDERRNFKQQVRQQRRGTQPKLPATGHGGWQNAVLNFDPTIENSNVVKIPVRLSPGERPTFTEQDVILQDGDIVFIESRDTEVFYTAGLLGGGQYELPRDYDLRLLEAISIAQSPQNVVAGRSPGGSTALNADVEYSGSRVIVMRTIPGGNRIPIEVSIYDAIRDPRNHNLIIQPGDFIIVQYTKAEAFVAFIQQNLLEASIFTSAFTFLQTDN